LLAEHTRKSFRHTTCILRVFFLPCHPFLCLLLLSLFITSFVPSLTSLYFVSHYKTPVLCLCSLSPVLCPLSYISVPCLPSALPSLTSLSLYLVLYPLSHSSDPCLPSSEPDSRDLFPVSHSPFSVPLPPINCSRVLFSVVLFQCSCTLLICYPFLCSSVSYTCIPLEVGAFDGWLLAGTVHVWLVAKIRKWLDVRNKELSMRLGVHVKSVKI
jgi:hypothetical protein